MPLTFWTFLIGGFALSGFPLVTAGFWSKDEILADQFNSGHLVLFCALALAALLTAFYTMRQITLTFLGEPRSQSAGNVHESSKVMTLPLVVLAFFAITAGWTGIPKSFPVLGGILPNWFGGFVGSMLGEKASVLQQSLVPLFTSLVVGLGGLFLGWWVYRSFPAGEIDPLQKALGQLYTLLVRKYYVDEFYQAVLIKPSRWVSETLTSLWIDKYFIDVILHGIGRLGLSLGQILLRRVDQPLINGGGNVLGKGTRNFGFSLGRLQSGKVQQYMLIALVITLVAGIFLYLLLVLV